MGESKSMLKALPGGGSWESDTGEVKLASIAGK